MAVLLALTACGSEDPDALRPAADDLHTASATVLEWPSRGPELCVGGVAESSPPQCGGVPLVGWDGAQVEGEQSANGTTWGEFTVIGRYDGTSLTLTQPPGPPAPPPGRRGARADADVRRHQPDPQRGRARCRRRHAGAAERYGEGAVLLVPALEPVP